MKNKKLFIGLGIVSAVVMAIELVLYAITGAFGRSALYSLFGDDPELTRTKIEVIWPKRGKIFDCKGRTIATSRTVWDVHLDCTVLAVPGEEWESLASDLSKELEAILGEKKAWEYNNMLNDGRAKQKKYLTICRNAEDSVATALMRAPLLNMGQFDGGAIFESISRPSLPYGKLGRRTIGYCRSNTQRIGLQGAYDYILGGKPGEVEYVRKCRKGRYYWKEKTRVDVIDGKDITCALDMDLMAIVDSELRAVIEGRKDVASACAVLMEAESGAVRSMVNLMSGKEGDIYDELYNMSIANEYEPGRILTGLPFDVLENGLGEAKFDIEGLREPHLDVDENGMVNVFCTPLHVLRIFGGIANGGEMFNPYLVTESASKTLCSKTVADSLKAALTPGCLSTAIVPHASINGSDRYRYPSGARDFVSTWCGFLNGGSTEYVLMCAVFSKHTINNAPHRDIPEKVVKGIMSKL